MRVKPLPGFLLAGAMLLVALAAPAGAQSPSPSAGTAPSTRLLVPSAGFTVELPADWLVLELGDDPEAASRDFFAVHPELEGHVARFLAMGPMNVIAMGPATAADPFPPTFGAFKGMNMGMTADQMLRLTLQSLPRVGVTGDVASKTLTVDGQPGYALHYDWSLPGEAGGAPTPVHVDQVTIVAPDAVWAYSVTDDATAPDAWEPLLGSFRLLPAA
jgi:hypothetical protein